MRAELIDEAVSALAVTKRDEPLGQELDAHRRAIVFRQFLGKERRRPVAAEQLPHRRGRTGLGDELILVGSEHLFLRVRPCCNSHASN